MAAFKPARDYLRDRKIPSGVRTYLDMPAEFQAVIGILAANRDDPNRQ